MGTVVVRFRRTRVRASCKGYGTCFSTVLYVAVFFGVHNVGVIVFYRTTSKPGYFHMQASPSEASVEIDEDGWRRNSTVLVLRD
jgi:hypothetical protein